MQHLQQAQLLLRKPIVLHCLEQPCTMLTMTIPDVEILNLEILRVGTGEFDVSGSV